MNDQPPSLPRVPALPACPGQHVSPAERRHVAQLLSLVCPGLGQLLTGRWAAGISQLLVFLGSATVALGLGLKAAVRTYAAVFAVVQDPTAPFPEPDFRALAPALAALGLALASVVWSVWDAGQKPPAQRGT